MAAYSAQVASYERKTHRFGTDLRKSEIHHTQEGLQSAKAPMMFFAIKKVWESTMRISPPLVRLVGAIASIFQVYLGGLFYFTPTPAWSCAKDAGRSAGRCTEFGSLVSQFRSAAT